ncbi:hypothetical protein GJ744_000619 [Endocarpon pusillum]|uniref:Uncharacterized protein n=1 Tax=Endocarpon pusillum TaxID=364733 RepID=A0A8H7AI68_9EURO|nr:hypothetical protein GJ744_000619 [Endocarpon pusillum]
MSRRYRYMTRDGHPPNQAVPPGVPHRDAGPQFIPVFTQPPSGYPQPIYVATPPGAPPPPPGYCWLPTPAPAPGPTYAPPPPPYQPCAGGPPVYGGYPPTQPAANPGPIHGTAQPTPGVAGGTAGTLPPGARVRGEIPVFPNRNSGYIFSKKQCCFNIIEGRTKPWKEPGCEIKFTTARADCRMGIKEFIEQVGAKARAPARATEAEVGMCEVIETGDGTWQKGSQFSLGDMDARLAQSLADVGWDELRGEAGMGKPVWLVLLP